MVKHFLNLQWKAFFRSANFKKDLGIKIIMGFVALYFLLMFLVIGFALYPYIKKNVTDTSPFKTVNNYLFYWFLGDLMFRFFFQKLPVMAVKPLLTLALKKSRIVHYILGKSVFSFFNILPLFAIIPFVISLITHNYALVNVLTWLVLLICLILISHFLNFIIESFSAETELNFLPIILFVSVLYGLNHFEIISLSGWLSKTCMHISNQHLLLVIPLGCLGLLYFINYKILAKKLYLDKGLKTKTTEIKTANLNWTKQFGETASFMQLDLKLLWRNKRPRSTIFLLVLSLLYGLIFYTNPSYQSSPVVYGFVGIFVTGIFLINFGQFIPAWDSSYYSMLMSQNIKYKAYLKSKYTLMVLSVIILFVLTIPYVYFGWKILIAHFAAAIYNIGINSYVIMYAGAYNRKKIDLNKRAAFNYQGTGAVQWLISIPLMLFPISIFSIFHFSIGFNAGIVALIVCGVLGIIFHKKIMIHITKKYHNSKYKMIAAFNQDN